MLDLPFIYMPKHVFDKVTATYDGLIDMLMCDEQACRFPC